MVSFYADGASISLSEQGDEYSFKAARNESGLVDLVFRRVTPGFQVGKNGTTYYGTDPEQPWGEMRHRFWPRCAVTGTIVTPETSYDFKGRGCFVHAIQGMKPHHAAAMWDFVTFQTPTYSAVMMEFTTPAAYASTRVNVGGVVRDNEIVYAGATNTVKHLESKEDPETNWPEPISMEYKWEGKTKNGQLSATLSGPLGDRLDRIDVLFNIPSIIKSLVGGVVGTKPYVYQVRYLIVTHQLFSNTGVVFQLPTGFSCSLYQEWRRCSCRGTGGILQRNEFHLIMQGHIFHDVCLYEYNFCLFRIGTQ